QLLVAIHYEDSIQLRSQTFFHEQRNHENLVDPAYFSRACFNRSTNRWVSQGFQVGTCLRVGEYDVPQGRTVEVSILGKYRWAKTFHEALERGLSGLHDIAGQLIRVDDRNTERTEEFRGCGLAAGDASGQSYTEWSATHGRYSRPWGVHAEVCGYDL